MSSADETRATLTELFAGRFTIGDRLDWGGLALMYRGATPEREFAIAVLPLDCESHPDNSRFFFEVLETIERLQVDGLAPVVDGGVQLGVPYLAYPYLPDVPLSDALASGAFEPRRALALARRILEVLDAVHDAGTFHGDLTPRNVLLDDDGAVRIIGLGIAQLLRAVNPADVTGPTGRGSGKGAVRYLAPEILGGAMGDMRSDIFSVGALLHHMVVGDPPGAASPPPGAFDAVPGLREVLERALAHDPEGRFASARAMHRALDLEVITGTGCPPSLPAAPLWQTLPSDPGHPPARARSWGLWLVGALLLGGAGAGATVLRGDPPQVGTRAQGRASTPSPATAAQVVSVEAVGAVLGERPDLEASSPAEEVPLDGGPTEVAAETAFAANEPVASPLPEALGGALRRIEAGETFEEPDFDVLYAYTRANPRDLRGHLVLARAFMSRRWYTAALRRYAHALRLEPAATEDPQVLDDLITIVQRGDTMLDPAWPNFRRFYGRRALPAVEERTAAAIRWDDKRRLRRLASRLRRLPEHGDPAD